MSWGAGPRASQYLILGGKARAVLHGRYYVSADDIRAVAHPVLRHRIITNFNAEAEGIKPDDIVDKLIDVVPEQPSARRDQVNELQQYLDPKTLVKIGRLDLVARLVVEGYISGLHRSPYHGFSVEFAEHREYVPGDDIQHLDWRTLAKTDRYYIKQYEEETNLRCTCCSTRASR